MRNHHERVIQSAKEWLNTVDREEFIAELLELQAESSGPTVEELIATLKVAEYPCQHGHCNEGWDG